MNQTQYHRMSEWEVSKRNAWLNLIKLFLIAAQTALFMVIWYSFYQDTMLHPYYYWGNFVIAGVFAVLYTLFARLYGGLQVNTSRTSELIYSLAISFGDVGKAIVVVIMVMQIAGSSGTFPIELLPEIYQKFYRFFPFPYAIDAMRECICGMYGNYYWQQIGFLLLFAAAALLIGLLVRKPFMGLNRFMEEKLEETELL